MAAILRDTVVVAVVHTCPRTITLAIITRRKPIHGFLCFLIWVWGSHWRLFDPLELRSNTKPSFAEYYSSHCDIYMRLQPFKGHQAFWEVRSEGVVLKSVGNLSRKIKYFLFSVK